MNSNVSILLPCRGDSPFLNETLNSIERSTTSATEVLVIDDGLTEKGREAVEKFKTKLPLVVEANAGIGLVDALNTGLHLSKSEYICRIDSDDIMCSSRISSQLKTLSKCKELVATGSQCIYIDSTGKETGTSRYPVGILNYNLEFSRKCLIAHPSTMFLREAAIQIGGYRSLFTWNGVDIAEDFDFWLRMARIGLIEITAEYLIKYRQHAGQLSSTNTLGQLLGTPYIAAVNLVPQDALKPKITFSDEECNSESEYLNAIRDGLNNQTYLVCKFVLTMLKAPKRLKGKLFHLALSKLLNMLSR